MDLRVVTAREPVKGLEQRRRGADELQHLPLEVVDPLCRVGPARREDLLLDLVDVDLEARECRPVVVDHPLHDRVKYRPGPVA